MNLNELKWAKINSNEPKWIQMNLNEPEWAQIFNKIFISVASQHKICCMIEILKQLKNGKSNDECIISAQFS